MERNYFTRYLEFIVRHRRAVIAVVSLITLLLVVQIRSLKVDMDPDIWAPQQHPYVQTTRVLEQVFGGRNIMTIGIIPRHGDVYEPSVLARIDRIQRDIERLPEAIPQNVLSLAARKAKSITGTADGMQVRRLLDPLPRTPAEIARLRSEVAANPIYINALVSADGKAAAVVADFRMRENASYAALFEQVRAIVDRERDEDIEILMGGLPVDFAYFEFHMQQMPVYFGIALLIIMAIQYWSFRSLQGMLLPIGTALLSVVWALGLMGLLGVHMDGMNTTTPILIMAVAAGHAIQILKRYYEEYRRLRADTPDTASARDVSQAAVIASLAKVGPVMLVAGSIAVLTFFSLTVAGMSVVRHFGLFAGAGILAALILEMSFIPAVRSLLPPPRINTAAGADFLERTLYRFGEALGRGRAPLVLAVAAMLVVAAASGVTRLTADNSLKRYHVADSEVRVQDAELNARFGGTNTIFFLVEAPTPDRVKDPAVLAAMERLQVFLDGQPGVGKTQSIVDLLKRMNRAMHADQSRYETLPDSRELVAQYLLLYSLSGDPQDFDNLVDTDYRRAVLWVYLKDDSTAAAEALYERARAVIAASFPADVSVRIGGSLPQSIAINNTLTEEKYRNMVQMGLMVLVLAALVFRSPLAGVLVAGPLMLTILVNFGLMGWLGVPLDMATAGTASMAIGIGADYEIYLLFRLREELRRSGDVTVATRDALVSSGKAVLFVALSIAAGYAVLLVSGFAFYSRLALMVIATMSTSALAAVVLTRALVVVLKPRFLVGAVRIPAGPSVAAAN